MRNHQVKTAKWRKMTLEQLNELPGTSAEAKASGYNMFFTGKLCTNGHLAPRYIRKYDGGQCAACNCKFSKEQYIRLSTKVEGEVDDKVVSVFGLNVKLKTD